MYVYGHKNPDTDAIVAAIIAADYYNKLGVECTPIRLGELNKETQFLVDYFGFEVPELMESVEDGTQVVLVDHNEIAQSFDNLRELYIYAIIDHHKFNLQTDAPLNIRAEIIGSTASILYKMYEEAGLELNKQQAGMMIAAILSDTLFFRSPTTTDQDRYIVDELNQIAQIEDLEAFSIQMFDAKSNLSDFNAQDIVEMDYKTYQIDEHKISIGVVETTNTRFALDKSSEIIEVINKLKSENNLDVSFVFVVDIINEESIGICVGAKEVELLMNTFEQAKKLDDQHVNIGNILSRKKQMVPAIEKTLLS